MRSTLPVATAAMMLAAGALAGPISNPSFESNLGAPTGWTTTLNGGSVSVVNQWYPVIARDGAGNPSFSQTPYTAQDGNNFLVIETGAADAWVSVRQTFDLNVGDQLDIWRVFDWGDSPFDFNNDGVDDYPDQAQATLTGPATNLILTFGLVGTDFGELPSAGPNNWLYTGFTATTAGTYTLELAARNTYDDAYDSYGLYDLRYTPAGNQPPTPAPEPATLTLLGLGLAGLGLARRRRT